MVHLSSTLLLATLAALSLAIPSPLTPDPSGAKNVGNGHGAQFITGGCLSNADCASACCASPFGICSGPGAQFQQGKTGCGFSSTSSSSSSSTGSSGAAPAPGAPGAPAAPAASAASGSGSGSASSGDLAQTESPDAPGAQNVGNGAGKQFITGACLSDADCQSGCCAKPLGVCSGPDANFQNGKQGCGFVGSA